MAAKKTSERDVPNGAHVDTLVRHIEAAMLPGDDELPEAEAREAAAFLLTVAANRPARETAIALETVNRGEQRFMRIGTVNDDMPFLVDSAAAAIAAEGLSIDRLLHPIVPLRRADDRSIAALAKEGGKDSLRESMIYIETPRTDAKHRQTIEALLRSTIEDVRAAVADWPELQAALVRDADRVADEENAELLRWLNKGMLTQLGHLVRHRDGRVENALGICRASTRELLADASYDRAFTWFDEPDSELRDRRRREPLIIKANRVSQVHRRVPLDLFIVPVEEDGEVTALSIHAGVWTSAALAAPPSTVPRLRAQQKALLEDFDFDPLSHAGKGLTHALTALPHDLIIGFAEEDIARVAVTMMGLVDRPRPRLSLVEAPLSRHLFAFVWLPRDMLATQVRLQIQELLEQETGSELLDYSLEVEGGALAMLRFVLDFRSVEATPDEAAIETRLQTMLRGWNEAVEAELAHEAEPGRAAALAQRYAGAFPSEYRGNYDAAEAARDIGRLRHLGTESATAPRRDARLFRHVAGETGRLRLKIYQHRGALPLSDAVPALENFGFRVLAETNTPLDEGRLGTINDFTLALPAGLEADALIERSDSIEAAIAAVLNAEGEDDPFNRLVTGAGFDAREADWLRAIYRYARQAGMSYFIHTVVDALTRAPAIARALVTLFVARHDPGFEGDRDAAAEDAREAIRKGLAKVAAINDDRLLRLFHAIVEAMLRTNAFAPAADEALAFKLDSAEVPGLPRPVPWREIFVYSRRLEGIHLRAGPVARGGIRWSDRRDDFRTEVLGLMKAQRVKNAVIVPTGAKGGFYPKRLPDPGEDREAWAAEGQAAYEIYIRSLLSITDNIVDDAVVHPEDVVIHDGEDPYFVVAADKGTARFSDVANAIAESRDFWLDDAFASGGSNGYDHKAMGITARGAWVSVQRHFREMGVDVQEETIRVAGCGDMSGDVFGNGMLLSKAIKLVAAFDHRHIFLDPDPDPQASFAERERLFALPRSSWADYDEALISKGGGVFARDLKRIKTTKAIREALDIEDKELDPDSLISAILKAPVDLMWFGGIGTYIKAEAQPDIAVGDPANDGLRVNGEEVRARVIGEGANLAVTQAGRIEYALQGGRINTDFIDNSGGVDCSDNEVNIKIALAAARRSGKLSDKRRNALLADMTEEVAAIVLEDNRLQALALSIAQAGGARAMQSHLRLIETLEDRGALDRRTEGIAEGDVLSRRAGDGVGLTRPELAVLLSTTKLVLQDAIEASELASDPCLESTLIGMFPSQMQRKYKPQILGHQLRVELIATEVANRMVNRMGLTHPFELAEEEGVGLAQVAAAFVAAERLFDIGALWSELDAGEMPEPARLRLFDRVAVAMRGQMADLLRAGVAEASPSELVGELKSGIARLDRGTDKLLAGDTRLRSGRMRERLVSSGAPDDLAAKVAHLFDMDGAVGLARLAVDIEVDVRLLAAAFTDLGARLGLDWAQGTAALASPADIWERLLVAGLARDFQQMRLDFLRRLSRGKGAKKDPGGAVERWAEEQEPTIRQFRAMVGRAQAQNPAAPAVLAQIASQARNLLAR